MIFIDDIGDEFEDTVYVIMYAKDYTLFCDILLSSDPVIVCSYTLRSLVVYIPIL